MRAPVLALAAAFLFYSPVRVNAQQSFDVASVKSNNSDKPPTMNFPLGPGDAYVANGGFFNATNLPLITYINFAYKVMGNQREYLLPQLPAWVTTDRFDIQARVEGNPGKDQMRLLMRALLAERFKLAIHNETREVPVLALMPAKPGSMGPRLKTHPADVACSTTPAVDQNNDGEFPALCGGLLPMPPSAPGRMRIGARNVTMDFIANTIGGMADIQRPMINKTGLNGGFDFSLEWVPERGGAPSAEADSQPDSASGPGFQQALREQLGLRLVSQKGPVEVLVLGHIEHPSGN